MQSIKAILIVAFVVLLVWVFRHRARVEMRVAARIMTLVLVGFAIASIANPDITQRVAEAVGVTRGTDLVLYVLVVVFAFTTLAMYFRLKRYDERVRQISRDIALRGVHANALANSVESDPRLSGQTCPEDAPASAIDEG